MERVVIHKDSAYQMVVDNFVRSLCDTYHLGNYYATISVPIMDALKKAMALSDESAQPNEVVVSFDYDVRGVCFRVDGTKGCFRSDDLLLIRMLCDQVEVSDDYSQIELSFAIRGIDCDEAAQRVAILEHFYHPTSTKVLQA